MSVPCEEMLSLLSSLADGRSTPGERKLADDHLAQCPRCRTRMQRLGDMHQHLESYVDMEIPVGFAERTARQVLEKAAAPSSGWRRLLELPRRFLAWASSWPDGARVAVGTAGLTAVLAGAGATAAGTLLHGFSVSSNVYLYRLLPPTAPDTPPWKVPFPLPSSAAEAEHWRGLLPHLPNVPGLSAPTWGVWLGAGILLSVLILLCGLYLLRTGAAARELLHARNPFERPALLSGVVRGSVGLLLLGPVVALPMLLFHVLSGPYVMQAWNVQGALTVSMLFVAAWGGGTIALGSGTVLARAVREVVPSTAVVFGISLGLGLGIDACVRWLLRLTYDHSPPHAGWVPTTAAEVQGLVALIPVVLTPSALVGEVLLGCLAVGIAVGTTWGMLLAWPVHPAAARSWMGRAGALVLALGILGAWSWHFHGVLRARGLFEAPLAAQAVSTAGPDVVRTVALLASETVPTAPDVAMVSSDLVIPGALDAVLGLPEYSRRRAEPFGFSTPSLYRLAMARARLDWDDERLLELYQEYTRRVPGGNPAVACVRPDVVAPGALPESWMRLLVPVGEAFRGLVGPAPVGSVSGRLLLDGRPATGHRVRLVRHTVSSQPNLPERERRARAIEQVMRELRVDSQACRGVLAAERAGGGFLPRGGDLRISVVAKDGRFHFGGVPPGRYFLAVQWPGRVALRARGGADELVTGNAPVDVGTIRLQAVDRRRD